MRRMGWIVAVVALGIGSWGLAQGGGATLAWICKELGGAWASQGPGRSAGTPGSASQTSFTHQGAGVFRVHSSGAGGVLARWNGRQVRVAGPLKTDENGWTYFKIDGEPCRIGMRGDGMKVLEVHYADPTQRVELTHR